MVKEMVWGSCKCKMGESMRVLGEKTGCMGEAKSLLMARGTWSLQIMAKDLSV